MRRGLIYILGLISGVVLMTGIYLLQMDKSYIILNSDYNISDIGYLKKGTKLKVKRAFSESFSQYSLILNISDAEEVGLFRPDKWNMTIPYWLMPITDEI